MAGQNKDSPAITPIRRHRSSTRESITVDTTPQNDTSPSRIPNPRKKARLNYNTLNKYGFQGPPLVSPSTNSTARRAQILNAQRASQPSQQSTINVPDEDDKIEEDEEAEKKGGGKRAWRWEYYKTTTLSTTWASGRAKTKFTRNASKLHGSVTALKLHVEIKHHKSEQKEGNVDKSGAPTALQKWMKPGQETLPFEEALVDWIVETCQPFTVTETQSFKTMLNTAGFTSVRATSASARGRPSDIEELRKTQVLARTTVGLASPHSTTNLGRDFEAMIWFIRQFSCILMSLSSFSQSKAPNGSSWQRDVSAEVSADNDPIHRFNVIFESLQRSTTKLRNQA
ncbi:hypothetical protein NA56DRAFT_747653 [Hyaloscypha hepaticicola]|uniref:Uncharacterized protein n=1 Tax=Hyaloscypha hepaticicola TaxID=2082293 RepID=A0A2J6Q9W2_9HELO|nr:hypothetical protein NA56DRAFT_747653 [Hyaloscypha hepaticicola]